MNIASLVLSGLVLFSTHVTALESLNEGKRLYEETCISCHGITGNSSQIKLVVKPRRLKDSILSQAQMVKVISDGGHKYGAHSDMMPAFKYVYEEEQIKVIAEYVATTFNAKREQKITMHLKESNAEKLDEQEMLKIGEKIFKRNCSLCHGIKGDGESVYVEQSRKNKEFLFPYDLRKILLNEKQIFLYIKFGGHYWGANKKDMPAWKKKYDDTKLTSVAHFVKTKIVASD